MQSNTSDSIVNEIDAIIAQAMAEYAAAKGTPVFTADAASATTSSPEPYVQEEPAIIEEVIPVNSNSILVEETTSRFSGAVWFENIRTKDVTLAGLGGIGSYVAFLLGRLHVHSITIYDDDVVELGNMSGQLYSRSDVGKRKAWATYNKIQEYADYYDVNVFEERFIATSPCTNIMICGFDNMVARRTFFQAWKEQLPETGRDQYLFIDGRLAAETLQVFCIKGDDEYNINRYDTQFLFRDEEADETQCSYKQTSFMANMIGSIIINLFVNFCANQCDVLVPRDLPFLTEYSAETMYFKVTN